MNNPLVQVDPGLYIWTIVTFVVLLLLLAKFAWRPLLEALERRQEAIRKSLDEARQAKQELGRLHEESARIMAEARAEADAIISRTRAAVSGPSPAMSAIPSTGRISLTSVTASPPPVAAKSATTRLVMAAILCSFACTAARPPTAR